MAMSAQSYPPWLLAGHYTCSGDQPRQSQNWHQDQLMGETNGGIPAHRSRRRPDGTFRDQTLRGFTEGELARETRVFFWERKTWECIQILFQRIRMAGVRSEDELGVKWDRCLADTGIKLLGGDA